LRAAVAAAAAGAVVATTLGASGGSQPTHAPDRPVKAAAAKTAHTEAAALQAAETSGQRVEVSGMRSERRDIFANPDGTFTAREYTEPVRAWKNGTWVGIDRTLVGRAGGSWGPKASAADLEFSSGAPDRPFVTLARSGRTLALTWPYGRLPAPEITGDTATYRDALPGVDLAVRAESDGFAQFLVVRTPQAATDPRLARVALGLTADGLKVTETPGGALRAEDAVVGGTVFEAGRPVMWDSASVQERTAAQGGQRVPAGPTASARAARSAPAPAPALPNPGGGGRSTALEVELGAGNLTLVPDQQLLTKPDTVFPVVIDPFPRNASSSAWTGVMSGMPTEQDWKYTGGAGVGKCPTDYNPVSCNGVGTRRLLFTFPVSHYRDFTIVSATFSARLTHIYSATPSAEPLRLYRIGGKDTTISASTNYSNTSADWTSHLQTHNQAVSPTSCSSPANLHFENGPGGALTQTMQTVTDDRWSSLTLGLRASDESRFAEWKRICGNAFLAITYNTKPDRIAAGTMTSDAGGHCTWGGGRPYVSRPPVLTAYARDPDHGNGKTDQVKVEFKVEYTVNGVPTYYTYTTPQAAPTTRTPFRHTVKSSIPQNTTIYWSARASDGEAWGPWSWDDKPGETSPPQRCEFIYDRTLPGKPNVKSLQYPSNDGGIYHDGVGTPGTFTFSPSVFDTAGTNDVVKYHYAFDGTATPTTVALADPSTKTATVTWTPNTAGRHWVEVVAVDPAGNTSTRAHYEFLVSEGAPAAGQWNLADKPGSASAHDERGDYPATPGTGATFGVDGPGGKADSAVRLDGTAEGHLDTGKSVIDTSENFTVSAWVRPTGVPTRDAVVISQDGTGEPGFTLGYDSLAGTWAFGVPVSDVQSLGRWKAVATGTTVVPDQWVLLTGVHDAQAGTLKLYVNQHLKGTVTRGSVWKSYGPLQIGRTTGKSGYRDHFTGDLAEVRAYNRVLPAAQVAELLTVKPERKGYWQLDTATGGTSPETASGQPLTLHGNASVQQPADPLIDSALAGAGHLVLDGTGDYASTATAPVTGGGSFTISARARLTSLDPVKAQTVFSLPGTGANRVVVRYQPATAGVGHRRWQLAVTDTDSGTGTVRTFHDDQRLPETGGAGQHLAVVYDAFANTIRLYVDGALATTAYGTENTLWTTTRGLQIGRSAIGADPEYFAGALDEVRIYSGAADETAVVKMASGTPVPDM
jgi:hypothetical protein